MTKVLSLMKNLRKKYLYIPTYGKREERDSVETKTITTKKKK